MVEFEGFSSNESPFRLVFEVSVEGMAHAYLYAHNTGSTALYYSWKKIQRESHFKNLVCYLNVKLKPAEFFPQDFPFY